MNFQRICYKNCLVAFRLILQFTANHLGGRKSANIHSHRLLVFALMVFLFWSCNSVRIVYTWLTKSVFTVYIGLSLVVRDIIFFRVNYLYQNTQQKLAYHWRKNHGPIGMNHCTFSAAQDICSKLQNQAKCDSAAFTINPLKFNFLYTFLLLEVTKKVLEQTIIARWAIVPYLLNTLHFNSCHMYVCVYIFFKYGMVSTSSPLFIIILKFSKVLKSN